MTQTAISIRNLNKSFTLHQQGGVKIKALKTVSLDIGFGRCTALNGPSGAGKSSLLRCIYGNYKPDSGDILVKHAGGEVNISRALPREIIAVRRQTIGYVSQFLRVIPRVSARNIVAAPLIDDGFSPDEAYAKTEELLAMLNIPPRLWNLAPATFSGGEQQRVNIARGFIKPMPILLLDEPTASLDKANRTVVMELIIRAKNNGCAIIGIFHDEDFRTQAADQNFNLA